MKRMMASKHLRSTLVVLISLAIIGAFAYYLYKNADQYINLLNLSPLGIVLLLVLSFFQPIFNGMINTVMFRSLGVKLSHKEGFLLATVGTLANQLPISGGIATKAFYLKQKYNLSYTKNFSANLALYCCTICIYGLLGLAILFFWTFSNTTISAILWIGFGAMAATIFIFIVPLHRLPIPASISKWVQQALEGWMFLSKNPRLLIQLMTLQIITMLLLAGRFWLAFHMLSQDVTAAQVILYSMAATLQQVVSLAPGGLGVREAIVGGMATSQGYTTSASVVAVGLDRLTSIVVVVLLGWISTVLLGRELSSTRLKTPEQQPEQP